VGPGHPGGDPLADAGNTLYLLNHQRRALNLGFNSRWLQLDLLVHMPTFPLNLPSWPGPHAAIFVFPVTESGKKPLIGNIAPTMQIGTPFHCTIETALQAADRYMYIKGRPFNPIQIVDEWTSILRWEVSNYWSVDPNAHQLNTANTLSVTPEHRLRSGEVMAYGISILLLEDRLKLGRQNFFFYEANPPDPILCSTSLRLIVLALAGGAVSTVWKLAGENRSEI